MSDTKGFRKTFWITGLVSAGMFAFGFALVPLYDVFCRLTDINGKTSGRYAEPVASKVDMTRWVRVQFVTQSNADMPWVFQPLQNEIRVHPGQLAHVEFRVHNVTAQTMVAQAVPSVSPSAGASYFHKTECFCFNSQSLNAGEEATMPLRFYVDPALPGDLHTLTLSYTLFDISNSQTVSHPAILPEQT
ncbi:MAG: cytochrome c oxidase assembly protein [Hahellaceae bacterium]|nr:cytochrome c oxidase assembly protein [Hahellaceae bacterium]